MVCMGIAKIKKREQYVCDACRPASGRPAVGKSAKSPMDHTSSDSNTSNSSAANSTSMEEDPDALSVEPVLPAAASAHNDLEIDERS
jgi:hypothetical protein